MPDSSSTHYDQLSPSPLAEESDLLAPLEGDEARIEAYLDGDLLPAQRLAFEDRLKEEAQLAAELAFARRIRDELRELPRMSCPEPVSRAAIEHAAAHPSIGEKWGAWLSSLVPAGFLLRPAVPTLAALGVVVAVSWHMLGTSTLPTALAPDGSVDRRVPAPVEAAILPGEAAREVTAAGETYSAADVEQAEQDIKLALAYLGRLGSTADRSVRQLTIGKWTSGGTGAGNGEAALGGQEP